jgi:Retrotransposon gag protein/Zinc knuckle
MTSPPNPVVALKEAKHMKIPLFYGRTEGKEEISAEDLIDRIEALVKATGKGGDVAIQELYLALREDAVKWYKSLPMTGVDVTKWSEVKKRFLADYQFKIAGSVYKLEVLRQKSNERVIDFFARVNEDFEHIMEEVTCSTDAASIETRTQIQKAIFIAGLRDELKSKILPDASARKTLMTVRTTAQTLEYVDMSKRKTANPVLAMKEMEDEIDMIGNAEEEADDEFAEEEIAMINRYRAKVGKRPMRRRGGGRGGGTIRFTGKCFNCNLAGHRSSDCRQPKRNGVRSVEEENEYHRENREESLSVISPLKNW